jgi:hypothetical protein
MVRHQRPLRQHLVGSQIGSGWWLSFAHPRPKCKKNHINSMAKKPLKGQQHKTENLHTWDSKCHTHSQNPSGKRWNEWNGYGSIRFTVTKNCQNWLTYEILNFHKIRQDPDHVGKQLARCGRTYQHATTNAEHTCFDVQNIDLGTETGTHFSGLNYVICLKIKCPQISHCLSSLYTLNMLRYPPFGQNHVKLQYLALSENRVP